MTVLFDESYIEYGRKKAEKDYEWLKKKFKATYPDNGEGPCCMNAGMSARIRHE